MILYIEWQCSEISAGQITMNKKLSKQRIYSQHQNSSSGDDCIIIVKRIVHDIMDTLSLKSGIQRCKSRLFK